jgi:HPt (histidine-containing phosphotransfer) domain-containing protein
VKNIRREGLSSPSIGPLPLFVSPPSGTFSLSRAGTALDLAVALECVGDDRDLLEEIVGMFLHDVPIRMHEVRVGLAKGDLDAVVRVAHMLRGTGAQVGARALAAAAFELERSAVTGMMPAVEAALAKLDGAVADLFRELGADLQPTSSAA